MEEDTEQQRRGLGILLLAWQSIMSRMLSMIRIAAVKAKDYTGGLHTPVGPETC
jgi:hypothetical protein